MTDAPQYPELLFVENKANGLIGFKTAVGEVVHGVIAFAPDKEAARLRLIGQCKTDSPRVVFEDMTTSNRAVVTAADCPLCNNTRWTPTLGGMTRCRCYETEWGGKPISQATGAQVAPEHSPLTR